MAFSLSELKKNSKTSLTHLREMAEKLNDKGGNKDDERFWKPTVDENGNGSAVIRFLPAPPNEDIPYVRIWTHGFQGPSGMWYIENSLTTIGKDDPVSKSNGKLWKTGLESDKVIARQRKRKLNFISNILVVRDPAHPENDGKVFLFKYGKRIFDKINDKMNPSFEDEEAVNPFDPWEGSNFRLRVRRLDGYPNYDKSEFDSKTSIGDDKQIEAIWKQQYSLQAFLAPENFKSYEELEARLNQVLEIAGPATSNKSMIEDDVPFERPTKTVQKTAESKHQPAMEDEDDELALFKSMLDD